MPDLVPVDYDPFVPQSPLQQQVAGFPQRAADLTISALGPLGEAGMTVGDWLRTGHVDPRDIPQVAGGIMLGTMAPEAEEAAPLAAGAKAVTKGIRAYHGSPYDFPAERLIQYPNGETAYIQGKPDILPDVPEGATVLRNFPLGRQRLDKIGTGEGAQAYGHGLYEAEAEPVAQQYRDALASRADAVTGTPEGIAKFWAHMQGGREQGIAHLQTALAQAQKYPKMFEADAVQKTQAAIDYLKSGGDLTPASGKMYEVNINADPEHFLDWDKPLSEQSEHVKNAIAKVDQTISPAAPNISQIKDPQIRSIVRSALKQNEGQADQLELMIDNDSGLYNAAVAHAKRNGIDLEGNDMRASDYVYQQAKDYIDALHASQNLMGDSLAKVLGIRGADMMQAGPAAARLRAAGIPGIRYLDQGSRGSGTGTHNYVVFDDKLVDIIKKYGLAGLVAGGAAHFSTHPVDHDPFAGGESQ